MVILKMHLPKLFRGNLFMMLKEFYEIRRVHKAQLVSDLVDVVVRIEQETPGFPDDMFVQHFAGALPRCLAAGRVEILGCAAQLSCQHTYFSLDIRVGEEKVDIAGVELGLYARVEEGMSAFFQEQCDQGLEETVDAMIFIDRGVLGIGHQ